MELQQFIKQSLVEIMTGLKEAQDELKGKSHARICPAIMPNSSAKESSSYIGRSTELRPVAVIEFDVAVEVTSTGAQGSGGIGISVFRADISSARTDGKDAARLKFSVPVSYPEISGDPAKVTK